MFVRIAVGLVTGLGHGSLKGTLHNSHIRCRRKADIPRTKEHRPMSSCMPKPSSVARAVSIKWLLPMAWKAKPMKQRFWSRLAGCSESGDPGGCCVISGFCCSILAVRPDYMCPMRAFPARGKARLPGFQSRDLGVISALLLYEARVHKWAWVKITPPGNGPQI